MKNEFLIKACSGKSIDVKENQLITIVDLDGGQVVDFFAEVLHKPDEFLSTGVTIDCNESLRLGMHSIIYTNLYRRMFQILADDVGEHDLLHPCCRTEMYDFFYHNGAGHPNCLGLMYTKINTDGTISVETPLSKAGDSVTLKAFMDVRLGIAACSVSESKCNSGKCSPVKIVIED